MPGLGSAEFANAMKTLYLGPLNDQTVRAHVLLDRIQKNSKDVSGNFAYIPLISSRNPAVGGRRDPATTGSIPGPKLPEAGRQGYAAATFTMGLHYGRGQISGSVKRKSRADSGAFAKALQTEMEGLMRSLPDDLNRQICGNGTGRVGTMAATASNTVNLTVSSLVHFNIKVGDRIHSATIAAGASISPANGALVTAVNYDVDTSSAPSTTSHWVVVDTALTATVNANALYAGSGTSMTTEDSSRGQDIYGIQALIDNGNIGAAERLTANIGAGSETDSGEILAGPSDNAETNNGHTMIGGIVRSSNPFWQSVVKRNPAGAGTLRPLTQNVIYESWLTAVAQHGAKPEDIELYMDPAMWGTLGMVEVGGRVYNDYTDTVDMGWTYIKVMGSKAFYDRDLPRNQIFYLNMKALMLLTQNGYELIDDDGNVLRMVSGGGRDAWEFSLNRDVQLGANNLRSHVRLMDIQNTMSVDSSLH